MERLGLQPEGERPERDGAVEVLNPSCRVPVSLIIDDSTCLVNLAHFCIPQFAEVFPEQYKQPWRTLPREIPDSFVRKFGEWSQENGIKGKYSVIPYPACVGWLDQDLPGWSRQELQESLALVRTLLAPNWDFHPEMVSHTWVIDTKTGRPHEERTSRFIENWRSAGLSTDEMADYMAYALRILRNVEIPCEGLTTPGGYGCESLEALGQATLESCRDVFGAEIPHYFRHVFTGPESVAPRVEYALGLGSADPRCVVSIIGCTGDWFGGWDGLTPGSADLMITEDLQSGRLVDVIERSEPAILVCHWPGIYFNGEEFGFRVLKETVRRLHARYDHLVWMKLSEISRYWAARELTGIRAAGDGWEIRAPFACPRFTVRVPRRPARSPRVLADSEATALRHVTDSGSLAAGTWMADGNGAVLCFDLPRGNSRLIA